jgi:hypothetical protein
MVELSSESAEGQSLLTLAFRADCPRPFGDPVSFWYRALYSWQPFQCE